jgi:hypothetical protein
MRTWSRGRIGSPAAPAIVWLRFGTCTSRVLFAWLEPFTVEIQRRLDAGEKLIEVRDARR